MVMAMTLFSPLVWYHHYVFLALPLAILLIGPDTRCRIAGFALIFMIQVERLFDDKVAFFSLPATLAGLVLLAFGLWIYLHEVPKINPDSVTAGGLLSRLKRQIFNTHT